MSKPTYRLRFFFDYNCGGCLWYGNDASYAKIGLGVLDNEIYDLNENIILEAKIKLPLSVRQRTLELDKLFSESLNWNNPSRQSSWDKNQWENFYEQAKDLCKQISSKLGDDFEIVFMQP